MKKLNLWALLLIFSGTSCVSTAQQQQRESIFDRAEAQTSLLLEEVEKAKQQDSTGVVPRTLNEDGELHLVRSRDWTSGFFPGVLWFLYEETGGQEWLNHAKAYTAKLEKEKFDTGSHDTGFKIYCSFGNGYRLTGNQDYRDVIVQTAKTLSTRFNPTVGAIRSWDHNKDKWQYPVIIDNMMNLELLFAATRFSGDSTFYNIAVAHANTTLSNHFREDHSTFHVIGYDPETGEVLKKSTHQGYSDASSWARGQAWAVYGFTMSYRETGNKKYLEQAENTANFVLNHPNLPEDMVPYWDFDVPELKKEPRDVSAAVILASSFLELSTYSENGQKYRNAADKILKSIAEKFTSPEGGNRGFILDNSTGHKPKNSEVDVPINYADYYYLEALLRQEKLDAGKPLFQEKNTISGK